MRAQRGSDVIIVLVGNKTDLASSRVVSAAEIESHANEQDIMFIETSAKEGFNIKLLFRRLATALPNLEGDGSGAAAGDAPSAPATTTQVVNLTAPPPAKPADKGGCAAGCY